MNNLKRVLSLALSGIMLVGMMAIGASAADFTDAEKIQHTEAVNVLVALKVINGQDDGSFNPEGDVTRAQMAKMIAVAMNGGNEANTGTKTTPSFTDIKGHWAESYIEYCADLKIISGRGDGTFDPDGKVTGLEATKMVLTAMGFDAEAYKLTGASWAVRTDEVARTMTGQGWTVDGDKKTEPKMYKDLDTVVMANNATRDTAAQLIWNGLQNRTRTVQPTTNTNSGAVEWTYVTNNSTLLNQRFGADVTTGTFKGNYYTGECSVKGEIKVDSYKFPYDLDISNIGEEVKIIWKDGTRGTANKLDSKDVIFGVFNTGASKVVTGTLADVKDQKTGKAQINIDGEKYDLDYSKEANKAATGSVDVVVNYCATDLGKMTKDTNILAKNGTFAVDVDEYTDGSDEDDGTNSTLTAVLKHATGDTVKAVIDPDTNQIDAIYITTSKIAAVTAINSSKVTLNNGVGSITIADNDVAEDLKKGDIVTVSTLYKDSADADDAYSIVKKAEVVEGEVEGYDKDSTVTVDGTKYKIYNKANMLSTIPNVDDVIVSFNDGTKSNNTYIEEDVALYMVNGYVGAAVQTSKTANNYSLITEVKDSEGTGSAFNSLQLQVMDAEGTKSIITVSDDSKKTDSEDYHVGDIITYTMDKSGEAVVDIEGVIDYDSKGIYDDDIKSFGVNAKDTKLTITTTDCVLFVQTAADKNMESNKLLVNGASYKAYSIRSLGEVAAAAAGMTTVTNKDGKVVAAFLNYATGTNPSGATSNTVYGIISAANGRVKDYYKYEVQSNGETYVVNSKNKSLAEGDLVFFDEASDNEYGENDVHVFASAGKVGDTGLTAADVYTKSVDGSDALTFYTGLAGDKGAYKGTGMETLAMDKDCKIVYVNLDKNTSGAEASIDEFDSVTGYKNAAILTKEDSNKSTDVIVAIYVETSNTTNIFGGSVKSAGKLLDDVVDAVSAKTPGNDKTSETKIEKAPAVKLTAEDKKVVDKDGNDAFDLTAYGSATSKEFGIYAIQLPAGAAKKGDKVSVNDVETNETLGEDLTVYVIVGNWDNDGDSSSFTVKVGENDKAYTFTFTYPTWDAAE